MPRRFALVILTLSASLAACSKGRPVDDAKPVVTPSVTVSPSVVASGGPVQLALKFAVAPDAPAFKENLTVFVHVVDADGRMIGSFDHDPPQPTQSWKPGSTVEYTQPGFAPTSRYVGAATLVAGLYSRATGERVPLAGEAVERRAVKVGSLELRERSDPLAVVFREGWHPVEVRREAGLEWRWSTKSARLSLPNPRRASDLVLDLDQPHAIFPIAQHVEVRVGESVVDAFDLEPGARQVRRIALEPSALGDAEIVELEVVCDKTFVPSKVAELQSSDTRQLGIRVFRAFVEPKQ